MNKRIFAVTAAVWMCCLPAMHAPAQQPAAVNQYALWQPHRANVVAIPVQALAPVPNLNATGPVTAAQPVSPAPQAPPSYTYPDSGYTVPMTDYSNGYGAPVVNAPQAFPYDQCPPLTIPECPPVVVPECPPQSNWLGLEVFGEYLYLRSRDTEVAYAVPIDGPIAPVLGNGIQIGPTAVVDFDHDSAFRVGGAVAIDNCRWIRGTYSWFETSTADSVTIAPPDVIRSLVTHPLGANGAFDGLDAAAQFGLDYQIVDLGYLWRHEDQCGGFDYGFRLGARYANVDQNFRSQFETNGGTFVNTNVSFDGAGIRAGAMGDWFSRNRRWLVYARSHASLLAGTANANYLQGDIVDPVEVQTSWRAGRFVSILDAELGVGWQNCDGGVRVTVGYLVSTWLNMVQTDEFIAAVQQNQFNQGFDNLGDMMSFDGLTGRLEVRF